MGDNVSVDVEGEGDDGSSTTSNVVRSLQSSRRDSDLASVESVLCSRETAMKNEIARLKNEVDRWKSKYRKLEGRISKLEALAVELTTEQPLVGVSDGMQRPDLR